MSMPTELEIPQMEIVKKDVDIDYDKPTVLRNEEQAQQKQVIHSKNDMDYLDVPAFLRRQAD
jgi:cell division protein FtsZ